MPHGDLSWPRPKTTGELRFWRGRLVRIWNCATCAMDLGEFCEWKAGPGRRGPGTWDHLGTELLEEL